MTNQALKISYDEYAKKVLSGSIVVGEYIVLAVNRYMSMRKDARFEFRPDLAERVIRFFSLLRHTTGRHAGKPFVLQPWQQFIVANIFGFVHPGTNERIYKDVYIEIARKNGKTALAAGICLYCLIADGEMSAEVDLAANSKEQANIALEMCKKFSASINQRSILKVYRDSLIYERKLSKLKVFAADSSKLDGFNASMYLLDEYHEAKNTRLRDVLQSSMGMRENPLSVVITTAGFDKLGPCYQMRNTCLEVLRGVKEDKSLFAAIFTLDVGDDWRDDRVWVKSSPNLGVTVRPEFLKSEVQKAINTPSSEVGVRTKNLNEWMDSEVTWIPSDYILKATRKVDIDQYATPVYVGVDLAAISDLTAVAYLLEHEGRFKFKVDYYIPEQALFDKYLKATYQDWASRGLLTVTPGNVTDYDFITNDIMKVYEKVGVHRVGYDSWNATQWAIDAVSKGLPLEEFSQTIGNFNRPTRELERLLLAGLVDIEDNEITRFCFRNVALKFDHNGNCKPNKENSKNKIDGCIAILQALGMYLNTPQYSFTI